MKKPDYITVLFILVMAYMALVFAIQYRKAGLDKAARRTSEYTILEELASRNE